MALTQTAGKGTLVNLLGVYTATGNVTVTGSGTNTLALAGANLTVTGASNIIINPLTASLASTVTVTDGSTLTLSGTGALPALTMFTISGGGDLTIDSTLNVSALQGIHFADGTGYLELGQSTVAAGVLDQITGFRSGDTLVLDGANYTTAGSSYDAAAGTLTLVGANGTPSITLPLTIANGMAAGEYFHITEVGGNADITLTTDPNGGIAACYCRGTRVRTGRGDVAVEDLVIGDTLLTVSGALRPLRWIGTRSYGGRFLARNAQMLPVVIKAGALADSQPERDLWLSPMHAMFLQGVLVPAMSLVNGASVTIGHGVETVEYFHLELESHDVIYAEGATSESYVDDENRFTFHNAASFAELYPDHRRTPAQYAAPRVESGPALEAIRADIAARAGLQARMSAAA